MTAIRKYNINAGNEIDYVSTKIIDKICIITYQLNNVYNSKIINLKEDELEFIYAYLCKNNKELLLATSTIKLSEDIDCYFKTDNAF